MTDEQLARYEERIAPHRDAYRQRQFELEESCAIAVARSGRGIRTSGRYWALGAVLAGYAAAGPIAELDAALEALGAEYQQTAERIEAEVLGES